MKRKLVIFIWLAMLLLVVCGVRFAFRKHILIDAAKGDYLGLPATASNICQFYKPFWPAILIECDIPLTDLTTFCDSNGWKLQRIEKPISVRRFVEPARALRVELPDKYSHVPNTIKVRSGMYYISQPKSDEVQTSIFYDADSGRAYFDISGR